MIKVIKHSGGAVTIDGVTYDKATTKIEGNKLTVQAYKVVMPSRKNIKTTIETNTFAVLTENAK